MLIRKFSRLTAVVPSDKPSPLPSCSMTAKPVFGFSEPPVMPKVAIGNSPLSTEIVADPSPETLRPRPVSASKDVNSTLVLLPIMSMLCADAACDIPRHITTAQTDCDKRFIFIRSLPLTDLNTSGRRTADHRPTICREEKRFASERFEVAINHPRGPLPFCNTPPAYRRFSADNPEHRLFAR